MPGTRITELLPPEGGELRSFATPLAGVVGSEPKQADVRRVPADKETRRECCAALSSSTSTVEVRVRQGRWSAVQPTTPTVVSTQTNKSTPREYQPPLAQCLGSGGGERPVRLSAMPKRVGSSID